MFDARSWPIGGNMLPFGDVTPANASLASVPSDIWASHLRQMKRLGVDLVDPTDAWLSLAKLSEPQLEHFRQILADEQIGLSSISMTRNSIIDQTAGERNFQDALRLIEIAPSFNVGVVNIGFMQTLTPAQRAAPWFWLEEGHRDSSEFRALAIERVRALGDACESQGIELSIEMYEDTFVGSGSEAVKFLRDVNHACVGLNPDIANFVRLHCELEPLDDLFEKVLPYANFWHMKNYSRDYDPRTGAYSTAPLPLKYGYINYRKVIKRAIELGFRGPICCEHYGSDAVGVIAENVAYVRSILDSLSG